MENAPELFDKKVKKGRMSRPKYLSLYGPPEILNTDQGRQVLLLFSRPT